VCGCHVRFLQVDAYAELPYFMNPVLAACQMVNVAKPGSAPALADAKEDMTLFSPALADKHGEWLAALLLLPTASVAALLQDSCSLYTAQHILLSVRCFLLSTVSLFCPYRQAADLAEPLFVSVCSTADPG
jgi:hypothetical protein